MSSSPSGKGKMSSKSKESGKEGKVKLRDQIKRVKNAKGLAKNSRPSSAAK